MAKNPILPLYYNDLTTSTQDWTDEEFGAYVRLLIHQWRQGSLPNDYQRLTRIATSLSTNWPLIKSKFPEVDGVLKNPYMEEVRTKKAIHSAKQKDNIQKRYQNSTKLSTKDPTKRIPLESEIEKEIENELEVKGVQGENQIDSRLDAAFDEITLDTLKSSARMAYPGVDIEQELIRFKLKVQASPRVYADHDTGGLRLAFNAQLRSARPANGQQTKKPKAFEL